MRDFSGRSSVENPLLMYDYADKADKDANLRIIEAVAAISKELIRNTTGHTVYRKNTQTGRIERRGVFEYSEYDIMVTEMLDNFADTSEHKVIDHVIEHGTINKFAKVIYVTGISNKSQAAELEALEKCMVVYA